MKCSGLTKNTSNMLLLHCGIVLLFLNNVRTTENYNSNKVDIKVSEINSKFSWWPSVHNAASLVRMRRQAEKADVPNPKAESKDETDDIQAKASDTVPSPVVDSKNVSKEDIKPESIAPPSSTVNTTVVTPAPVVNGTDTKINSTAPQKPKEIDLNNPGVLKRGFIVFGGFALLAVAYFIFYRRKGKNNDTNNTHNTNDNNQFRYGVLQSEDRRDNMELSRVPLTMESDDDEDEDLEIFDLEQKKKSLSYVNLQTNDEDVVFSHRGASDNDRDNLLLDIEDGTSETLINWSNSGSKSIL